jgi:hypothetical protein
LYFLPLPHGQGSLRPTFLLAPREDRIIEFASGPFDEVGHGKLSRF